MISIVNEGSRCSACMNQLKQERGMQTVSLARISALLILPDVRQSDKLPARRLMDSSCPSSIGGGMMRNGHFIQQGLADKMSPYGHGKTLVHSQYRSLTRSPIPSIASRC